MRTQDISNMPPMRHQSSDHIHQDSGNEFFIEMDSFSTKATQYPPREELDRKRGVRLYQSSPERVTLQIRCPATLSNMRDGKNFSVATASLSLEEMRSLSNALSKYMSRLEES